MTPHVLQKLAPDLLGQPQRSDQLVMSVGEPLPQELTCRDLTTLNNDSSLQSHQIIGPPLGSAKCSPRMRIMSFDRSVKIDLLIDGKSGSFDSLGKLENLEKLKLLNDVSPSPPSEGQLRGLPPPYRFPKKLKSLTLADTFLDWSNMSILGLLENLEVLKLKDGSFMGKCWEAADGGFRRLEVLHIGRTDLVLWIASAHHFPRLRRLELQNCEELKDVPIGLADIENFQVLDLYRTKFASASAKKIREAKKKQEQNGKLSIFPLDE
ncbi:UNVERIFIED_CONTAM: putative disease resistance protein [Sesamum indicum]